jgi:hypothetical protein
MAKVTAEKGLLWSDEPIDDVSAWCQEQQRWLDVEHAEEVGELHGLLGTLSATEAQTAGLSLVGLRVADRRSALFGRIKIEVVIHFRLG